MTKQRHQEGWVTKKAGNYYGHYYVYVPNPATGKDDRFHKSNVLGPIAEMYKWEATAKNREIITGKLGVQQKSKPDPNMLFGTFANSVFIPMKQGKWKPATKITTIYLIQHYLVSKFGDRTLESLTTFELQIFLNELAQNYAQSMVERVYMRLKGILKLARKQRYIQEDPAEDLERPIADTKPTPVMKTAQLAALFAAIVDPMDKCLFAIGVFCALRSAEVFGLIWSSYLVDQFRLTSTAWLHVLYRNSGKTPHSGDPIPIPDAIQSCIAYWQSLCADTSPDALMFPYMPRWGQYKGQVVPWDSYYFMSTRILPIALKLGIPKELVNFQVFRRTAMTELQDHGTIKDLQALGRHATPVTTLKKYVMPITENMRKAINSRTRAVLELTPPPCVAATTDLHSTLLILAPRIGNSSPAATLKEYIGPITVASKLPQWTPATKAS